MQTEIVVVQSDLVGFGENSVVNRADGCSCIWTSCKIGKAAWEGGHNLSIFWGISCWQNRPHLTQLFCGDKHGEQAALLFLFS